MPRPPKTMISRRIAVHATLEMINDNGYEAFSLEKLAKKLGVKTPSLYYHFASRTDLLNEAARAVLDDIVVEHDYPAVNWQEWFVALCMQTYRTILKQSRAAVLLVTNFPRTSIYPLHERGAEVLTEIGVPVDSQYAVMRGMEKLVFGLAVADSDDLVNERPRVPTEITRANSPHLRKSLEFSPSSDEAMVEQVIRMYLAGVESTFAVIPSLNGSSRISS